MKRENQHIRTISCGTAIIDISEDEVNLKVEKFGDCRAYEFISDEIPEKFTEKLKKYKCLEDGKGCIEVVGECLEDYFSY